MRQASRAGRQHLVDAGEHEGQHLTAVADDEAQRRMPLEGPRDHQPEGVQARLGVPAPGVGGEPRGDGGPQAAEQDICYLPRGRRRVQVQRDVEFLERGEQWLEPLIVEERIARSQRAVHQRADESQVADATAQFGGGLPGIARR
jgi:hypothetical protein